MRFTTRSFVRRWNQKKSGIFAAIGVGTVSVGLNVISNPGENEDDGGNRLFNGLRSFTKSSFFPIPPTLTSMEPSVVASNKSDIANNKESVDYDFVILGNGNAGRSALETLQKMCPSAKIAVVDPLRPITPTKYIHYFQEPAVGFHPAKKTVQLSNGSVQLRYRHAILVATGSRGAPPPMSLIDPGALNRMLELRPTESFGEVQSRPVLSPETVRQLTLMASSQGAKVGILGSGWEAVELAVAASKAGTTKPLLNFGSAGPLSHVLPRYLSTALTRRLRQCGIQIQERSLVRYVADLNHLPTPKLELHTAKSYDLIDTKRTTIDLLVVAPYVDGPRGTAVIPTKTFPHESLSNMDHLTWYLTWSQLTSPSRSDPSMVVCYADDGRIAVNAELSAASRVFAAGSAAKYPSSKTGHAQVAGEGSWDGALAGRLAAIRMSNDYNERMSRSRVAINDDSTSTPVFAGSSFAVWRSDMCSYLSGDGAESSALASIGVRALCVGNCDSERMATHGYWWTNVSIKRRNTALAESDANVKKNYDVSRKSRPVYGAGVMYYLDHTGRISGITVWGLPFTSLTNDGKKILNGDLLNRLKDVIRSNGSISQGILEELDGDLLQTEHLAAESRNIASIALQNPVGADKKVQLLGKPLYRYTAAKPPSITSIGMLRRKDQIGGGQLMGENIYVRNEYDIESAERPQSLVYVYPMDSWASGSFMNSPMDDRVLRTLEENEDRCRPAKEEPLWLRRGDETKMTNHKSYLLDMAEANMKKGQFSDGRDAVQQAPVPEVIQKFKTKMKKLVSTQQENAPEIDSNIDPKDGE